jgi:hypothetical protein
MSEVIVHPTEPAEPSMEALHAMLSGEQPKPEAPEPAPEPEKPAAEAKTPDAEPGAAEAKQEPEKAAEPEVEEELPEGVKKRIAREAEKQAKIQAEIDRAVSARKAKEEELKKLTGEPGSQPVKTAQPADGRPARPNIETFEGTLAEYQAAVSKYETEYEAWLHSETSKRVESEIRARMQAEEGKKAWNEAVKQHAELPDATKTVMDSSTPEFQLAVSALDNWAGVTVHLGKHPDELAALVAKFGRNPMGAIADLGKLEERLKPAPKQAEKAPEKMLPAPPRTAGGSASASVPGLNLEKAEAVEKASDEELLAEFGRMLKAG